MKNLLILFGGVSGEHDISLISASSVLKNIHKEKYNIIKVGITKNGEWYKTDASPQEIKSGEWENKDKQKAVLSPDRAHKGLILEDGSIIKVDVCFPVVHGTNCEDGTLQGLFTLAGIPFVGPGVLSSAMCMDKGMTKIAFKDAEIPQADWVTVTGSQVEDGSAATQILKKFKTFPLFIKPCNAGSSLGITKATNEQELIAGLSEAKKIDDRILVEEFIEGIETECAVLGNEEPKASAVGCIKPANDFYDFDAKYKNADSKLLIPAPLPKETVEKVRCYAVKAYKALCCKGMSRVDFFVKQNGEIIINEINTLPGFTDISMYPKLWGEVGLAYGDLIDKLIEFAK